MIGRIAPDLTPYITVELPKTAGIRHEFVVDTGFTGALYVPEQTIAEWGLRFITTASMALADQRVVLADIFEATIVWFSVEHRISVVAGPTGCDSLLGMELLEGCRIELDRAVNELRIDVL